MRKILIISFLIIFLSLTFVSADISDFFEIFDSKEVDNSISSISFDNNWFSEIKTGNYIVESQTGIDSFYDVSFEKINDSQDILIKYCLTEKKLAEAQKLQVTNDLISTTPYKDYKIPTTIKVETNILNSKVSSNLAVKSELTKDSTQNCVELTQNPYLVEEIKLGEASTYIVSESLFFTDAINSNITLEQNFTHLSIDTSKSPYNNLVLYYPFDVQENPAINKTYDYSNSHFDGTLYLKSNMTWNSTSIFGGGYTFNGGTGSYIATTSDNKTGGNGQNLSFSIWAKFNNFNNQPTLLIREFYASTTNNGGWMLRFDSARARFNILDSGNDANPNSILTPTLSTNQWYHIVGTYDGNNMSLYLNGLIVNSTINPIGIINSTGVTLNIVQNYPGFTFNGTLDEVMIFNSSLNSSEVLDIYNNQSQRFVSTGTQTIKQVNITTGYNKLNITIDNYQRYLNSNLSVRVAEWDISRGYKNYDFNSSTFLNFNDNNYVNITSMFNVSDFTTNAWVYLVGNDSSDSMGIIWRTADNGMRVNKDSLQPYCFYWDNNSLWRSSWGNAINLNTWYLISCVFNNSGSNLSIYVNGVFNLSRVYSGYKLNSSNPWTIGMQDTSRNWNGSIDEVRIYNRVLNSSELLEIYNSGRIANSSLTSTGLTAWYKLDEDAYMGDNQPVLDSSGNNYSGVRIETVKDIYYSSNQISGLVAYYHLDNNSLFGESATKVYDYSGNGNNATPSSAYSTTDGYYNNAYAFDGINDYITTNIVTMNYTNMSVCLWSKNYFLNSSQQYPFVTYTSGFSLSVRNTSILLWVRNASSYYDSVQYTYNVPVNSWQHICGVLNLNGTMELYVNNIKSSGVFEGNFYGNGVSSSTIGATLSPFNGSIDEVMIFNRTLSASEIQELYIKGRNQWNYQTYQNITGNASDTSSKNLFTINTNTTNILTDFLFLASPNLFYSPILRATLGLTLNYYETFIPTISFVSPTPANNSFNGTRTLTINFTGNDTFPESGWITLNNVNYTATCSGSTPYYCNYTFTNLANNQYTYQAWINDSSGNKNYSDIRTYTIDSLPKITNITISNSSTNYSTDNLNNGLVAYYKFDYNWTTQLDSSGYGNNGTTKNNVSFTNNGRIGGAYNFDGISSYITLGNTIAPFDNSTDYSVFAWAYPFSFNSSLTNQERYVFWRSDDSPSIRFYNNGTKIGFMNDGNNGGANFVSISPSNYLNKWSYIGLVYNHTSGNLSGYVNGNIVSSSVKPSVSTYFNSREMRIGQDDVTGRNWNGTIDEVRIYNRSLSASEVSQLYQITNPTFQEYANVTINATITDEDSQNNLYYQWFVDGVSVLTGLAQNILNYIFTGRSQIVQLNVNDSNNYNVSQIWNVSTTFIKPTISFTDPTPLNTSSQTNTNLIINVTGVEVNRDKVILNFNSINYTMDCLGSNTYYCSYEISNLAVGNYNYYVTINDTVGNINNTETRVIVISEIPYSSPSISEIPYSISIIKLNNFTIVKQEPYYVNIDNSLLINIYSINGSLYDVSNVSVNNINSFNNYSLNRLSVGVYKFTFNTNKTGSYNISIVVNDKSKIVTQDTILSIINQDITSINYIKDKIDKITGKIDSTLFDKEISFIDILIFSISVLFVFFLIVLTYFIVKVIK